MTGQFPTVGDNGEILDTDYVLEGNNPVLKALLEKMPVMNTIVYVLNQYTHKRHNSSCTKFAPYTVRCSLYDHTPTFEEIDEIEKQSLADGRPGVGNGWSSSQGFDSARKVLNKKYQTREVRKRLYEIDSDIFAILLSKKIPMGCSIVVDKARWDDTKDGKIDGDKFTKNYGHADCIQQHPTKEDSMMMIDSVGGITYEMNKDKFNDLVERGNIRSSGYVFIPTDMLQLPENFEILKAGDWKQRVIERQKEKTKTHVYGGRKVNGKLVFKRRPK